MLFPKVASHLSCLHERYLFNTNLHKLARKKNLNEKTLYNYVGQVFLTFALEEIMADTKFAHIKREKPLKVA